MAHFLRKENEHFDDNEKRKVVESVFSQYDTQGRRELNPIQMQILHGDMRIGGISLPQVLASVNYVCANQYCTPGELYDLLQEMDRRYFLLQSFRWDFTFLDRLQSDTITVEQAKWMMQSVHGRYFSQARWNNFIKSRAVPTSGIAFAEIEVMLCDIPSKQSFEDEEKEKERILKEKRKKQEERQQALLVEREKRKLEAEEARKRRQADKVQAEEERIKKEEKEDKEREAEEQRNIKTEEDEMERIKRLEDEERKRREQEETAFKDAEIHKEAAEKAVKETDDELEKVKKEKAEADDRKRKQLDEEEERLKVVRRDHHNKRIRYQLKVAIKSRDKYKLEFSIKEFEDANLSDDEMDLARAKQLLQELTARDGLDRAMTKKEIKELERAMTFVRKNGFEPALAREMLMASRLLSRLRRLERIRHEILELKQATVAEIRSYQSPPPIVHTVMTATFLLLGHKERETKDWKEVQALVGKTGKESLKRRCLGLEASSLPEATAKRARKMLGALELDDVRDISAGAATFFVWATTMIEESLSKEDEIDLDPNFGETEPVNNQESPAPEEAPGFVRVDTELCTAIEEETQG